MRSGDYGYGYDTHIPLRARSGDNLETTYTVKTTTGHLHSEQTRGVVKSARSDFPAVSRFNSVRAIVSGLLFVLRWVNGAVSRASSGTRGV